MLQIDYMLNFYIWKYMYSYNHLKNGTHSDCSDHEHETMAVEGMMNNKINLNLYRSKIEENYALYQIFRNKIFHEKTFLAT